MAFWCRAAAPLRVDAGVVDDRVHAPDRVDLVGDASGLHGATEIADDNSGSTRGEVGDVAARSADRACSTT